MNQTFAIDSENALPGVSMGDLQNQNFFRSPMSTVMPDIRDDSGYDDYGFDDGSGVSGSNYRPLKDDDIPVFKQIRLIITNKIRSISPQSADEFENPEVSENYEENLSELDENSELEISDKKPKKSFKFWKRKKVKEETQENSSLVLEEGSIADSINNQANVSSSDTLSFETGIAEHKTQKELMLDSENVNYDEETGDMVATGKPILYVPPQNTKVVADKMVYNQDSNILKAIGNVVVTRDGTPVNADYFEVDMNEEQMLMDNPKLNSQMMDMVAEKAVQQGDYLILTKGNIHSDKSHIYRMYSSMIGPKFQNMIVNDEEKSLFLTRPEGHKLTIDAEKIYIDAGKYNDKFTAKKVRFGREGKYYFTWPSITAYTNKDRDYFEASYPELGNKRKLGMFIGPGFVFGAPNGAVVKVIPFLNYQKKFGFGGALKYKHVYNDTELGYGTAANIFFLKGNQRLDDNLHLQYSANSYMDEWFLGSRMPKYMAEIFYDKRYSLPNFLAEGKGLSFRHRLGFGLMEDNDRNYYGEHIKSNGVTTTRLRYMAQIAQKLYSYERPEDKFYVDLSFLMQGSAALYGTGDTQFIGRVGPRVHLQYKNWMQDVAYYQSAYDDKTPIPRYDKYRYGHSALYLTEIVRVCKYLSIGWQGVFNLSDDSPSGRVFQENRFVIAVGPDDLKLRFGYDTVRETTYVGIDVAFDTKNTKVNYDKMIIKNPEKLGKKDKSNERKLTFTPATVQVEPKSEYKISFRKHPEKPKKVLEYAQVINIEDPDKERID
ncbi:LPS-assembly protein LptD [bacterium]|nr:LPS-assembly protein LptD [bacterium]